MTGREAGAGFAGWGSYRWTLTADGTRAAVLAVRFEGRVPLSADDAGVVLDALLGLSHPWCAHDALLGAAERTEQLAPLARWLRADEARYVPQYT